MKSLKSNKIEKCINFIFKVSKGLNIEIVYKKINKHSLWKSGMPAATMFSKFKSGTATPQNPIDGNPIAQHFEIGKQTACAGPELVWRIHDGYKKSDGRVSQFFFQLNII